MRNVAGALLIEGQGVLERREAGGGGRKCVTFSLQLSELGAWTIGEELEDALQSIP